MQPFLGLFFSMLLATGASLECETCTGLGSDCTGSELTCIANQDICVVSFAKTSIDENVETIWKGCEYSKVCKSEYFSFTLGQGKTSRMKTVCCTGDACKSATPELPPVNTKSNGMQCPACYSLTGSCPAEVVHCTGSEDHCLSINSKKNTGGIKENITIKACATANACNALHIAKTALVGVGSTYSSSSCWRASQAPPSTGFSLLALSGLLVMKMLF